ncbi:MAG: hypothetical protein A2Y78_00175 [Acidobacteria bacterium RBG_13_68_16]|nr:MAG: hypothetical protein A2Y78_00175 [Acidobacteria bacterium RBG_13_68_16]
MIDVKTLFTVETAESILAYGLEVATALGLPVTSWQVDDPSRVLFKFVSRILESRDAQASLFIRSGFLLSSEGAWKTLIAAEFFDVTRVAATYATSTITLANGAGGFYQRDAGDLVVKSSTSGVTYHSTAAFTLASGPGTTTTVAVIADEEGADGSAIVNAIDTLVSTMTGVTITASTAAVGLDEQSDASLDEACLNSLGALSPNGPPDAYNSVVTDPDRTGTSAITRAASTENSSTGVVTVYVAGPSGDVASGDVVLAQAAIDAWATPLCITATAVNATETTVTVTASVSGDDIPASVDADCEALIGSLFGSTPIGGLVSRSALISLIHGYCVDEGATDVTVTMSAPAADVTLATGAVPVAGTITITEV